MKSKLTILIASIPVLMLIVSITAFILNTRIAEGKPYIGNLSPSTVSAGDSLLIEGKNFGKNRDNSAVYISSLEILSKYITTWSEKEIRITIPERAGSGLLAIETDRGISEPVVLVLEEDVPFISTGAYLPGLPFIENITPASGGTGSVLTVTGDNFGDSKNNSQLLFSSLLSRERDLSDGTSVLENFLSVPDDSIISWDNKKILCYLPEFARTGDVYVQTLSGESNAVYFEQSVIESGIRLRNRKTYMFNQSVFLEGESRGNGKANVWFISPVSSINQRNTINLSDHRAEGSCPGTNSNFFSADFTEETNSVSLSQNTIIEIYEQNYTVDISEVKNDYDRESPLYLRYTESTELIPSSSARVKNVAKSVTRRKNSNLEKAEAIYDYVLARLTYSGDAEEKSPDLVIDTQLGDAESYALLFTALARSSGIPARPVSGFLVDRNRNVKSHWWTEFFIQDFGWFPLDPALADAMPWDHDAENPVEYYWGNIDNQHIAFSRGELEIPRLFPDGIVSSGIDYAFITHNVETDSKIIELRSTWSDVKIIAIY